MSEAGRFDGVAEVSVWREAVQCVGLGTQSPSRTEWMFRLGPEGEL